MPQTPDRGRDWIAVCRPQWRLEVWNRKSKSQCIEVELRRMSRVLRLTMTGWADRLLLSSPISTRHASRELVAILCGHLETLTHWHGTKT